MQVLGLPRSLFNSNLERREARFQRISSSSHGGILGGHLLQLVANQGCKRSVTISAIRRKAFTTSSSSQIVTFTFPSSQSSPPPPLRRPCYYSVLIRSHTRAGWTFGPPH